MKPIIQLFIPGNRCGLLLLPFLLWGCRKFVEVPEPTDSITTTVNFSDEATATSSLIGVYGVLNQQAPSFGCGIITLYAALSADELNYFDGTDQTVYPFQNNSLLPDNTALISDFWTPGYKAIYRANAVMEGVATSQGITAAVKRQLTGEAKFLRAFCHFYLTNLFGDIPLVTTTDWRETAAMGRTPSAQVYEQLITDLKDAQELLADDFSVSNGQRIRVNKWAAKALLARVYLYTGRWEQAVLLSGEVINHSALFGLVPLNDVFKKNSQEAIWQLETYDVPTYSLVEARHLIPFSATMNPRYSLTPQLLAHFDGGDQRRIHWLGKNMYEGTEYYYPFKYKVRVGTAGNIAEYYMMLRLGEQYLIRAEAYARQNQNLSLAIADLNTLRTRAGLPDLPSTLGPSAVLDAIERERQIELFAEWGHRWLDLKRTGRAVPVLAPVKGATWQPTDQLYPIPQEEIDRSPRLTQNPGY